MRPQAVALCVLLLCGVACAASSEVEEELFLKWGPEHGMEGSEKLMIKTGASGSRGLAARVRLAANETILRIPQNMILSVTSLEGTPFDKLWKELRRKGPGALRNGLVPKTESIGESAELAPSEQTVQTNMLALYLCHLMRYPDTHRWGHYVRTLPSPDEMNHILFWERDELDELRGTSLHLEARDMQAHVKSNYNFFAKLLHERYRHLFKAPLGLDEFRHALALVISRDFAQERSQAVICLMPINDLSNHVFMGQQNFAYITPSDNDGVLMVVGDKDIEAGEELLNTYGRQPNYNLMKLYGFWMANNPDDSLYLTPPIREPFAEIKSEWRQRATFNELAMRLSSIDYTLGFLRIIFSSEPIVFLNDEFRERIAKGDYIDWSTEREVLDFVMKSIQYPMDALIGRIEGEPRYHDNLDNPRVRMAVGYRTNEQRFFRALMDAITERELRAIAQRNIEPAVTDVDLSDPNWSQGPPKREEEKLHDEL